MVMVGALQRCCCVLTCAGAVPAFVIRQHRLGGLYPDLYNQLNSFLVFCDGHNASCKSEDTKCSSSDKPGWEKEKLVSE